MNKLLLLLALIITFSSKGYALYGHRKEKESKEITLKERYFSKKVLMLDLQPEDLIYAKAVESMFKNRCRNIGRSKFKKLSTLLKKSEFPLKRKELKTYLLHQCKLIVYGLKNDQENSGEQQQNSVNIKKHKLPFLNHHHKKKEVLFNQINISDLDFFKEELQKAEPSLTTSQRLNNNAGILYGYNSNSVKNKSNKYWIARSARLDFKRMTKFSTDLERTGHRPIVSAECLNKYLAKVAGKEKEICKLQKSNLLQELQNEIKTDEQCRDYYYGEQENRPSVIYLHVFGFNKEHKRGDYAIQGLIMSKLFGYNFFTPFHLSKTTFVTGENLLRPVVFSKEKNDEDQRKFYKCHKGKDKNKETPIFNPSNESTLNTMSEIGKSCMKLDQDEILKQHHQRLLKQENKVCGQYLGGWSDLFDTLEVILDPKNLPVDFHCYGGRHKTGVVAIFLRLLEGGQWVAGKKTRKIVFHKPDHNIGADELNLSDPESIKLYRSRSASYTDNHHNSKIQELFGLLRNIRLRRFNKAQLEYAKHNTAQYRDVNVTSAMEVYRLCEQARDDKFTRKMLKKYKGTLAKDDITIMRQRWIVLKQKYQETIQFIKNQNQHNKV